MSSEEKLSVIALEHISNLESFQKKYNNINDESRNHFKVALDVDAFACSSVLGSEKFDPDPSLDDAQGLDDKFKDYLKKDKLHRAINKWVLDKTLDPPAGFELNEKSIRIALVLAKNHDLCSVAYSDTTDIQEYTTSVYTRLKKVNESVHRIIPMFNPLMATTQAYGGKKGKVNMQKTT